LRYIATFNETSSYSQEALTDIHVERLCMKPAVPPRQESQDQDLHPGGDMPRVNKYGADKEVKTYFKYVNSSGQPPPRSQTGIEEGK